MIYDKIRILFMDDDPVGSGPLRERFERDGYDVVYMTTAQEALSLFREQSFELVIVKKGMSGPDISQVLTELKTYDPECVILVVIENPQDMLPVDCRVYAYEVVHKPFNPDAVLFLVRKGIELRRVNIGHRKAAQSLKEQNVSLQKQNTLLAHRIEDSTKNLSKLYEDLRTTYMRTIKVLAQAIDARDHYTHDHSERVSVYAGAIAVEMHLSVKEIAMIREACELHDLGKIGVEDNILGKQSQLSKEEWEQIRKHPLIAAQILEPLAFLDGVTQMVKQHHEHYNGTGYPEGRKGEEILVGARIIHVADAYEAMTSARSYRKTPLTKTQAVEEIKKHSGTQFDPQVVNVFLRVVDRF